jgi:hypothetical protein
VKVELTTDQCQFLIDIMQHIGGDPSNSRRKHAEGVEAALQRIGFSPWQRCKDDCTGSIEFISFHTVKEGQYWEVTDGSTVYVKTNLGGGYALAVVVKASTFDIGSKKQMVLADFVKQVQL